LKALLFLFEMKITQEYALIRGFLKGTLYVVMFILRDSVELSVVTTDE
jgi:hypothetical protein